MKWPNYVDFVTQNQIKFYKQGSYLVAKVRKGGKLHTIASGIKINPEIEWHHRGQFVRSETASQRELDNLQINIGKAKEDVIFKLHLFRKTGNKNVILKRVPKEELRPTTVLDCLTRYKEMTNKNKGVISNLEWSLHKYSGGKKLASFDIQDFYNFLKIKPNTKNTLVTVLAMVLRKVANINSFLEKEREEVKKPVVLTDSQVATIESDDGKYSGHVRLLMYTGLRYSELVPLLEAFRRSEPGAKSVVFTMPKTQVQRSLPLNPKIKNQLEQIQFIPIYTTLQAYFHKRYKAKLHNLRSNFITRAYRRGIPAEIISKAAGHKNIQTTIQKYLRLEDEDTFKAFD